MLLINIGVTCLHSTYKTLDDVRESIVLRVKNNTQIKNSAVLHGLVAAVICSVALGIFFGSSPLLPTIAFSTLFGAFTYTVLTGLVEISSSRSTGEDPLRSFLMFCSAYTISHFVFNLFLHNHLSYAVTLPLAIGAYAGHKARSYVN